MKDSKTLVCIIVAMARNGVIGSKNQLPWHIPQDLQHFRRLTMGSPVIMGEITHNSIGRTLPGRTNIVLSREKNFSRKTIKIANSVSEALKIAKREKTEKIFIIGGGQVYRQFIPIADRLYVTEIDKEYEGEVTFPSITNFKLSKTLGGGKHGDINFTFKLYERMR